MPDSHDDPLSEEAKKQITKVLADATKAEVANYVLAARAGAIAAARAFADALEKLAR